MENHDTNSRTADRIGRYLDGEKVALSAQEQLLASELDINQRALANAMDRVEIPQAAMDRIRRKTRLQVVAPLGRVFKVASLAAVAAAVLVAATLFWQAFHSAAVPPTPVVSSDNPLSDLADKTVSTESDKMELIAAMTMDDDAVQVAIEVSRPDTAIPVTEGN